MQYPHSNSSSRRTFLKNAGRAAAATTLVASMVPHVHAAENNTLKVVLIGCGGRGTGAAANALSVKQCPIKLVAMADVFTDRLSESYKSIKREFGAQVDVPEDRRFLGFDAYQKAMDCLSPGDIAIFTTPLAFRWVHFGYAIQKGLNVFMEKPLTADGPTSRKMLALADSAAEKNLKVGVGLMSRHNRGMQELAKRIHGGEIGDIILLRGYRMHGPAASMRSTAKPASQSEVEFQIRRFHSFLWASGGCYNDFYIHHVDHCCWMKGDDIWPVEAQGLGGRHYRLDYVDQNFDSYGVEYTFADGTKFTMDGRCISGCAEPYHIFAHGTKGTAIISRNGDCGGPSATFKGFGSSDAWFKSKSNMIWQGRGRDYGSNPYQNEWEDLVEAIRADKPYSEVKRGVEASIASSMGRMAAHTGQIIKHDDFLNGDHEFAPHVDKLTIDGPSPVVADANGKYPVPQPGMIGRREYA
jgi:predicted dehydrogenase